MIRPLRILPLPPPRIPVPQLYLPHSTSSISSPSLLGMGLSHSAASTPVVSTPTGAAALTATSSWSEHPCPAAPVSPMAGSIPAISAQLTWQTGDVASSGLAQSTLTSSSSSLSLASGVKDLHVPIPSDHAPGGSTVQHFWWRFSHDHAACEEFDCDTWHSTSTWHPTPGILHLASYTMHPLHGMILEERDRIKAKVHVHLSEEDLHDDVRDALINNNELVSCMITWIAQNLGLNPSEATYPDRGFLLLTLIDILAHLVWEEEDKVKDDLLFYHMRLIELNEELYDVPPQRNVFPLGEGFGTDMAGEEGDSHSEVDEAPEYDTMEMDQDRDITSRIQHWQDEEKNVLILDPLYTEQVAVANRWNARLQKIISINESGDYTPGIVQVIKQMKEVRKNIFSHPAFRRAIKDTGLTNTIEEICSPLFLNYPRNSQALQLELKYRIADQLSEILDRWTPAFITASWPISSTKYKACKAGKKKLSEPKEFLDLFDADNNLLPGKQNVSYCFFLANLHTFQYNYDRWLGNALEDLGYNVTKFDNEKSIGDFYSRVINLMIRWCTKKIQTRDGLHMEFIIDQKTFKKPLWPIIIKQTVKLRQLKQTASKYANQLKNCTHCRDLPAFLRCTQYLYFPHIMTGLLPEEKEAKLTALREELIGCGITMVGSNNQIQPTKTKEVKTKRRRIYNTDMYHPYSVGKTHPIKLQCVKQNEDIVQRCGHQLCLIVDEEDPKTPTSKINVKDFIWWKPFDNDILAALQDAVVQSTGVGALKRGAQFDSYSGGKMVPLGSRTASGGRAGDTYTSYAGLDATTEKGLDILFNQAAIADIMRAAAVHAHSSLVDKLEDCCNECDRMGMTGANIYNCTGYMAPIHRDQDATRGLSTQVLLSADSDHHEFAFCNIEYKYFIATTTNCLW
ncbi:hypothetical protein C8R42DRAFT_729838 [Lentinula raphanica]|nr:hypothetical protein C8R42DRAFT_729838 [Lentinula raphanica]